MQEFGHSEEFEKAFAYVAEKLFSRKTNLIYDHIVSGREQSFPTPEEIQLSFPNPCGYSTGMEDGMINGATMLDAVLLKYEKNGDLFAADFAGRLVKGMLNCAFSAKTEGFLPRAVAVSDGRSHYPDSSRDQYTMFAFGMHRYLRSPLCTSCERERIAAVAVAIARRAERYVTADNGYDMLTDDNRPTLVNIMWGDSLGNHEYLRLPMLYLLAFDASGDGCWLDKYRKIRQEAYKKSLPMGEYWHLYALQQMQASALVCYDLDPDIEWKAQYLFLMNTVADYTESLTQEVRAAIAAHSNYNAPQLSFRDLSVVPAERFQVLGYADAVSLVCDDMADFFVLQDGAQVAIISGLVPGRKVAEETVSLLWEAFDRIDLSKHQRNLPLFFLDGYYRVLI